MKVGVITNGISEDYGKVCQVMRETGIKYAEIQNVFNKRVEEITIAEAKTIKELSEDNGIVPFCVTTHAFNDIPVTSIEVGDNVYEKQMDLFKNSIEVANIFGTKEIRLMVFAKQLITFGSHGSDKWQAGGNKFWSKFIELYRPIIKTAEENGIDVCIENGFNAMVSSTVLAKKMIDELGGPTKVKLLWDPANAMYYQEFPTVEVYENIKEYISHLHIKDMFINTITSEADVRHIGRGQLAPYLQDLAAAMRKDEFQGIISLENIYRPDGGDFIDGYYEDIVELKKIFE